MESAVSISRRNKFGGKPGLAVVARGEAIVFAPGRVPVVTCVALFFPKAFAEASLATEGLDVLDVVALVVAVVLTDFWEFERVGFFVCALATRAKAINNIAKTAITHKADLQVAVHLLCGKHTIIFTLFFGIFITFSIKKTKALCRQ
jgi:hypothetical protein